VWRDELYFEYHRRRVYDSGRAKRRIRQAEELLLNAESFPQLPRPFGHKYPTEELDPAGRILLFDDFHDIFPGSGNAPIPGRQEEPGRCRTRGPGILDGSLNEIAEYVNVKGTGFQWWCSIPFVARDEVVETEVRLPEPASSVEVIDAAKPVASQVLSAELERDEWDCY